jgi:hypothetical protein
MNRVGTWFIRGLLTVAAVVWLSTVTWLCVQGDVDPWPTAVAPDAVAPARLAPPKLAPPRLVVIGDGIPLMPAHAEEPVPPGPVHPHPITATHQRIFEENRLLGALGGAVEVADAAGIRQLLAHYRADYPEDAEDVQDGYQAIADCLERPGVETRLAAERWSDQHHGSTVRRFVARTCQLTGARP